MINPFQQRMWSKRSSRLTMWSKLRIMGMLCVLGVTLAAIPARAEQSKQGESLLVNGGFEWPYSSDFRSDGGGFIAHGWNAWWYNDAGADYDAPEYKGASIEEDAARVRDGVVAQQYFRPWARHKAGLWQRVPVPANSRVRFTVWGHAWSTFCAQPGPSTPGLDCDPRNSHHGSANPIPMKIGIDPTGNTDAFAGTIVWSPSTSAYDRFQQFAIEADAQGDFVTVFVYSEPEWAAPVINVYWDNAVLTASAASPPTTSPTSMPTLTATTAATKSPTASAMPGASTPQTPPTTAATATPLLNPTGEATPSPATATATPEQIAALPPAEHEGRLCISLFEDINENGLRDEAELLLAEGILGVEGPITQTHVTDGASEPFCFDHLTPGQYLITAHAPDGYDLVSAERIPVTITGGGQINLNFGAARREQAAATVPASTSNNSQLLVFIAVIAGGILTAILGGVITFIVIVRRSTDRV